MKTVSEQIKELRIARGLTQKELAAAIDPAMLQPQIARYEAGMEPTIAALRRIGRALGLKQWIVEID